MALSLFVCIGCGFETKEFEFIYSSGSGRAFEGRCFK